MDVVEAIRTRKSIRRFKPDPVPKEVLKEILEIATHSPSSLNMQPWEITVITGKVLENIKQANIEMLLSGAPASPDRGFRHFEGKYRQRQVDLAIQIFKLMGIAREDKEKRAEWRERGVRFFDAPAAFILFIDKSLEELMAVLGIGAIAQTICLTALNYGLGTCIEGAGIRFPEVVRKFTGIPESKRMIICITIGYPDWDFSANKLESEREPLENVVTWCGYD